MMMTYSFENLATSRYDKIARRMRKYRDLQIVHSSQRFEIVSAMRGLKMDVASLPML